MLELAEPWNARVRGDEYETYTTPDTTYIHPDDQAKVAQTSQQTLLLIRKKRIKQWITHAAIFAVFATLVWLVRRIEHG